MSKIHEKKNMDKKIKICIELYGLHNGGIEKVFENYFSYMDRSQYDLHLLIHMDSDFNRIKKFQDMGFTIHQLSKVVGHRITIKNVCEYRKFYSDNDFDIIHSNCPQILLTLPFAKLKNIKGRILHSHNDYDVIFKGKMVKGVMVKLALRFNSLFANQYLACGIRAGESVFGKRNVRRNKVIILNNAFEINKFSYNEKIRNLIRKKYELDGNFVLGHVGRYEGAQKNQEFVIEIFRELKSLKEDSKLLMIGDGPGKSDIIDKVKKYGLENDVIFTGVVDNVNEFLQAMDFFVFPSRWEGLSVTILEAQAAGLHGIMSDVLPSEMNISGFFKMISLDESPKIWAEECLGDSVYKRENKEHFFRKAGYDIRQEAKKLNDLYNNLGCA